MKFTSTPIPGVVIIEPRVFEDSRGFFYESYHERLFSQNGIKTDFVQDNQNRSKKGVLRGFHYQVKPKAQAKLVRAIRGRILDVVLDVRPASKTFGRHVAEVLSAENKKMIYIPEGFAHAFLALEDHTEVLYKVSDFYSPRHERGIRWDDPALGIRWPELGVPYRLSSKDRNYSSLAEAFKRKN